MLKDSKMGTIIAVEPDAYKDTGLSSVQHVEENHDRQSITDQVEREELMDKYHQQGHFGTKSLIKSLHSAGHRWFGMAQDCSRKTKSCAACQRYTVVKRGYHPIQAIAAALPFDHVSFDLFEMTTSIDGFNYVLVLVDVCTRFVLLKPLRSKQADEVARALFGIFTDMGFPRIWQSDNGREFVNSTLAAFREIVNVEHRTITPYNPRANGTSERFVRISKDTIYKYLNGAETEWTRALPLAQYFINIKESRRHGSSPYSLFFGRKNNELRDYRDDGEALMTEDALEERMKFLTNIIYPAISEKVQKANEELAKSINKDRLVANFPVGTMVMTVVPPKTRTGKGAARYEGPFKVARRTTGGSYELTDNNGVLLGRAYAPDQLKVVAVSEECEPSYEVEKILGHKKVGGKNWYLIRWKNYGGESDSWNSEDDFDDIEVIREYWKAQGPKRTARATSSGQSG